MYPTPDNPAYGSFVKTQVDSLQHVGVELDVMVLDRSAGKLKYLKAIPELRRRIKETGADVVHAHYSYVGMVARTQWRVPVVVTFHGTDIFGEFRIDRKQPWWSALIVGAGRLLGRYCDAVIVQNLAMRKLIKNEHCYIVPHEIDFEVFQPTERDSARAQLGLDRDKRYLLFAARPDNTVKGFPLAEAAANELKRRDPRVELLIVHKETQPRLALYMSAADALVFPSLSEGSPNVVKQAMACNLPIVATDVGDIREVIEATPGCYVAEPTVEAFVDRLDSILKDRSRTNGRAAVQRFDPTIVTEQLIQVYEDAVKRHRRDHSRVVTARSSPNSSIRRNS